MGLGVFLEPNGELKKSILKWKEKVNLELPDQPYCSHPPHCTLIHTNIMSNYDVQEEIKKAVKDFPSFSVTIEEQQVFWDDEATYGGHTLINRISQSNELLRLQLLIAKILKPYVVKKKIPKYVKNNPIYSNSFKLYGFPFVGSHWIPHITIASIQTGRDHPLINEFLKQIGVLTMEVDEVSCWKIENNQHTFLERITLK